MAQVTNLTLKLQTGTDSTFYASWDFTETTTTTSSGIKEGDLVSIKSGATYYNGTSIPSWVLNNKWYISEIKGNRAVLGKSQSGNYNIQSPINTKYLTGGSSTSTTIQTLDYYTVQWYYDTGDNIWFDGGSSGVTNKYALYSNAPSNAIRIKVVVKPVSKTREVNGKETAYWSGKAVEVEYRTESNPPEVPPVPTVTIEKYKLTASIENISDPRTDKIEFQVLDGNKVIKTATATVESCRVSFSCDITAGGEYRVRCRAINLYNSTNVYGEWTDYTSSAYTIPPTPGDITTLKATSETSVFLEWAEVKTAKNYDIQFTTKKEYFDSSNRVDSINSIETTKYEKTGLESGLEYFFRLRAVNEQGESGWSGLKSIKIGEKPAAPTTWSSTTTVIVGDSLKLYWVHNSQDNSSQVKAELELNIGGTTTVQTIVNSTDEDEKDKTSVYTVDTSSYTEGTTILWRVRTCGITGEYGEWSIQRTVDIYAPPVLAVEVTDISGEVLTVLNSFPFYISATAGPTTQMPTGYHVSIISNQIYETVDAVGNPKIVNKGESVYSKYYDTVNNPLVLAISAGSVDLENNVTYILQVTVSMNSGLTASASSIFTVRWDEVEYEPDIEIAIDTNTYAAYIRPYCRDADGNLIDNLNLSVYRREFDGSFTELATNLDNIKNIAITDPHPALDYARYRVVATDKTTGAVSFYDAPGYPVGGKSIIIQWDEDWSYFESTNADALEQPPWSGSLLSLPYNIDISEKHQSDVSLVRYIGRKSPVTYYGTQLGETDTWNTDIPKADKETLYALRRLATWMGDVYVREPSGKGYWANITVSLSQKHANLVIPVTLEITRVEGGI